MTLAVRFALLAMLGVALAPGIAAHAATLSLVLDKTVYAPGETVTIRLIGDSQGAVDHSLFAALIKPDPSVLYDLKLDRFAPPTSDGIPWIQGAQLAPVCGPNPSECFLMNMIHFNPATDSRVGVDSALEPFTYAVLTGTAGAPGVYDLAWTTAPTRHVDFFGLTSTAGATFTIGQMTTVLAPEPGTAALLALGLVGLASARRRTR